MFTRLAALARNIRQSREGAVAIQMGIIFVVMLGMGALAIDVGFALYKHRQMQAAADAAAFSAAIAKSTGYPTSFTTEADAVAAQAGFVDGVSGVTVTVNNPPVSPPASAADAANASAVQVIIQQPQTLPLVKLLYSGAFNLAAQAVATTGAGGGCAWQLSSSANPGVTISNGATVTLVACGLTVCSVGNTALSMSGGTHLNITDTSGNLSSSYPVSVAGKASITNGAQINNVSSCSAPTCKASQGACAATANPYNSVTVPTANPPLSSCSLGNAKNYTHSNSGLQTISPGTWCNGVSFTNDAQIKLNPGVYYVNGGTFNVGGAVVMNGTGVTIVLTGSASNGYSPRYANVLIGNGAAVTLSAPTTGSTQGLAFFGDPNGPASTTNNCTGSGATNCFGGGASMNITGAIYFPSETVVFNNGITNPSGCTQLIAGVIQFAGGAQFSNNCAGTGTSGSGGAPALIE